MALQSLIWGLAQPFLGGLADRLRFGQGRGPERPSPTWPGLPHVRVQVGDLCDLLTGEIPGRTSPEQITLFKNNAGQGWRI